MVVYDKKNKYAEMTIYKRPKDTRYYLYIKGVNAGTLMIYDINCDFFNSELGFHPRIGYRSRAEKVEIQSGTMSRSYLNMDLSWFKRRNRAALIIDFYIFRKCP